ncbi:hypothetical protein [Dysgonomonas termitidis]|uniref:Uncharacterized protein n=1 Tax=Dysgonomonas termitidis TaxID=1516126 RepID=A0ABV9KY77_9BACT
MARQLIARGQVNIQTLNDAYTINQSVSSCVFAAASKGTVLNAVSIMSTIKVMKGDTDFTAFTIGSISKPVGFSAVTVNNADKTITYTVAAYTANLPDNGTITIPLTNMSVQDLHLIPFSSLFLHYGIVAPKSGYKGINIF